MDKYGFFHPGLLEITCNNCSVVITIMALFKGINCVSILRIAFVNVGYKFD